jgi:hypothetical protein
MEAAASEAVNLSKESEAYKDAMIHKDGVAFDKLLTGDLTIARRRERAARLDQRPARLADGGASGDQAGELIKKN